MLGDSTRIQTFPLAPPSVDQAGGPDRGRSAGNSRGASPRLGVPAALSATPGRIRSNRLQASSAGPAPGAAVSPKTLQPPPPPGPDPLIVSFPRVLMRGAAGVRGFRARNFRAESLPRAGPWADIRAAGRAGRAYSDSCPRTSQKAGGAPHWGSGTSAGGLPHIFIAAEYRDKKGTRPQSWGSSWRWRPGDTARPAARWAAVCPNWQPDEQQLGIRPG